MKTPELLSIGHIMKEIIRFPDKVIGPVLGSPTAYSAVTASRLGMKTGIVTRVGKDMPESLLRPILEAGVDTRGIKSEGDSTRTTILTYDTSGNKTVLYEKSAPKIIFEDIPKAYLKAEAAIICPMDYEVPLETSEALSSQGLLLMTDLGGFGGTVSTKHPRSKDLKDHFFIRELSKYCSIIKASDEDCKHLFGYTERIETTGRLLVELGANITIITLGSKGSIVFEGQEMITVPAFPTSVVDTTGAGDAYCAGFFVEYLRTHDAIKAAIFASATASIIIEGTGGVQSSRMPTTSQVRKRIAGTILSQA